MLFFTRKKQSREGMMTVISCTKWKLLSRMQRCARNRDEDNDIQKLPFTFVFVLDESRLDIPDRESCNCSQKMRRYDRHAIAIAQALRLIISITHIPKGSSLFNGWISNCTSKANIVALQYFLVAHFWYTFTICLDWQFAHKDLNVILENI